MGNDDALDRLVNADTLEEFSAVLAENIERWNRELREEGFQEGIPEGAARLLLHQLRAKFGLLELEVEDRVRSVDMECLLEWGERFVRAESLTEVFGQDPRLLDEEARFALRQSETWLVENVDRWHEKIRERGRQEGRVAALLTQLLRLKFGPLEPEIEHRVEYADEKALQKWCSRVFAAKNLREVLWD